MPEVVLREVFQHASFRGGQDVAVRALLAGSDAAVLLPTGAGKSVCYQVPAIVAWRAGRGTTIVVSPLIALMQDQVAALAGRGIAAAAIHSHQDDDEQREVVVRFLRGELALLYVSPERAALDSFKRLLARVKVAHIAIDEAHCLSQWGHDFRPEYLRLGELRDVVAAPMIALTATATPRIMAEIAARLRLRNPAFVRGDFARENLGFAVEHHKGEATRLESLIAACDTAGLRGRVGPGRAIVYCSTRKKTESVAEALKAAGFAAAHYHAGRTALARERAQNAFSLARTRVLVATNAFGMGIDYPDVRLIVHFQAPGSLEAYYQEAGRAGRDGGEARCLLLFGAADLMTQRRLKQGAAHAERSEDALAAVERYARARTCRQGVLVAHFTGRDDGFACGKCDVCTGSVVEAEEAARVREPVEALSSAEKQLIVDAAARLRRPVGKANLAKAMRGSRAKSVSLAGLIGVPEHGRLEHHTEASIVAAIDELLQERRLERKGKKYPTVWLAGRPVREARPAGATPAKPRRVSKWDKLRGSDLARELENYRKRMARQLKWKSYMVFQTKTILAIDAQRPLSRDALLRIPGLGAAKVERFGEDILAYVRRHSGNV